MQASSEVVDTLENAKAILRVTGNIVDSTNECSVQLDKVVSAIPRLDYLGITDPAGRYICRANDEGNGAEFYEFESLPTLDRPYYTETRLPEDESERYEPAVVVSYGIFNDAGILERVILAGFKLKELKALTDRSVLQDDTNIAIINRHGEALVGGRTQTPEARLGWIDVIKKAGQYEGQVIDTQGRTRDIFVVESGTDGIYVAISRPKNSLLSWSVLNPFSSLIVPFLAWLFGFVAIWLAADKLILVHLRKMRNVALEFAKGKLEKRMGTLNNAPQTIDTLGRSFDYMADSLFERETALSDSLDEKETLLREIHHRVKNNLQIIISLLNMQERKLSDVTELTAITETRSRINAIALVHRGLYESSDLRYVEMQAFLDRLVKELSHALGMNDRNINVSVTVNCSPMEADTATPVALFIVEALTNSVKHGVGGGGDVTISINQKDELIEVRVADNGGKINHIDASTAGTGTKLINGFARQLGGDIFINQTKNSYDVCLKFLLR